MVAMAVILPEPDPYMMRLAVVIVWLIVGLLARAYIVARWKGRSIIAVVPWPDRRRPYRLIVVEYER